MCVCVLSVITSMCWPPLRMSHHVPLLPLFLERTPSSGDRRQAGGHGLTRRSQRRTMSSEAAQHGPGGRRVEIRRPKHIPTHKFGDTNDEELKLLSRKNRKEWSQG